MSEEPPTSPIKPKKENLIKLRQHRKSRAALHPDLLLNFPSRVTNNSEANETKETKEKAKKRRQSHYIGARIRNVLCLNDPIISGLDGIDEMMIKQVPDILEALCSCCCQKPNTYRCLAKFGKKLIEYFQCKEFSGDCMRFFCPVKCREFIMKGKFMINNEQESDDFENSYLRMKKPLRCPCFCACRPKFEIEYLNPEKKYEKIGIINFECSFCDPVFVIQKETKQKLYYVEAQCCQMGLLCRNNLIGKTEEAHFYIYNYYDRKKIIGDICKQSCNSHSIADNFLIKFPKDASSKEKLLIMLTAIMIDYQYFENNNID